MFRIGPATRRRIAVPKHIADRPRLSSPSRPSRYLEIARSEGLNPAVQALRMRPEEVPGALRLTAFVAQARAEVAPQGRHVVDEPRGAAPGRVPAYVEIARREGLHPAIAALHSRARDTAAVARIRAFLRQARSEAVPTGRHIADTAEPAMPSHAARYVELARAEGIHPSVRALRTRRGDATAMIRLREFLRIARGGSA
jgi:hypothetical protein